MKKKSWFGVWEWLWFRFHSFNVLLWLHKQKSSDANAIVCSNFLPVKIPFSSLIYSSHLSLFHYDSEKPSKNISIVYYALASFLKNITDRYCRRLLSCTRILCRKTMHDGSEWIEDCFRAIVISLVSVWRWWYSWKVHVCRHHW